MPGVGRVEELWLELDDMQPCGLESAAGGDSVGVVAESPAGSKHLAGVQVEDLVLETAAVMSPLVVWAQDMLAGRPRARSGAVVAGVGRQEIWRLDFSGAMLAGLTLPACDAASTEPLRFGFVLRPARTGIRRGGGATAPPRRSRAPAARSFVLDIERLDVGKRTSSVGPLVVTWDPPESTIGEFREVDAPGPPRVGDLDIDVSVVGAQPLVDWHRDAVVLGTGDDERAGTLSYVDATFRPVLAARLRGLGIRRVSGLPSLATARPRVRAAFYCEGVDLSWPAAGGAGDTTGSAATDPGPAAAAITSAGRLELETTLRLPADLDIQSLRGPC